MNWNCWFGRHIWKVTIMNEHEVKQTCITCGEVTDYDTPGSCPGLHLIVGLLFLLVYILAFT